MKICSVVGARPQFIKAAMLSHAIHKARANGCPIMEDLIHTGQHFDHAMSDTFFDELRLPAPTVNLDIHGGTHAEMTGRMLPALESVFAKLRPDVVVVFGDTNSTMAAALVAAKMNVPVAHIEAGMRHYRRDIPEEINRVVTDHVSTHFFCSSKHSAMCLKEEGVTDNVYVPGDLMYDQFKAVDDGTVASHDRKGPVLCTVHRAANTETRQRLVDIMDGLEACPHKVVLPLHPRTAKAVKHFNVALPDNVERVDPVGYQEMLGLIKMSAFVITDSGGLQKDAFFCKRRAIVLSNVSPWAELSELDVIRLTDVSAESLDEAYQWACQPVVSNEQPYGDGTAAASIVATLLQALAGQVDQRHQCT